MLLVLPHTVGGLGPPSTFSKPPGDGVPLPGGVIAPLTQQGALSAESRVIAAELGDEDACVLPVSAQEPAQTRAALRGAFPSHSAEKTLRPTPMQEAKRPRDLGM